MQFPGDFFGDEMDLWGNGPASGKRNIFSSGGSWASGNFLRFFFCKFFVIDSHMNHLPMVHFFWYKDISIHALQESGDGIQSLWCLSPSPCTQVTMIPIHKKLMILILEIETSECVYDYIYIYIV